MSLPFHEIRRQPFIMPAYYAAYQQAMRLSNQRWRTSLPHADSESQAKSIAASMVADNCYQLLSLHYTGGEDPAPLRVELESVVEAYENYQKALAAYEGIPEIGVWSFQELAHYERCVQLIGLCYLLHRRDLLPRIAALQDPGYAGYDTLYEDLLLYAMPNRADVDALYHGEPYRRLVHAMYRETDEESIADLAAYCDDWYHAFAHAPWHDGHLRINGNEGDYFGYWAFEAGAVGLLCEIDDSSIDHLVYPKDLVAWARANKALSGEDLQGHAQLRCLPGQPCPRAGFWLTPARDDSRRRFALGETMPDVGGDYGATIWQWNDR